MLHCWNWLPGWQPERLPVYLALHPHPDPELLTEGLLAIRVAMADG